MTDIANRIVDIIFADLRDHHTLKRLSDNAPGALGKIDNAKQASLSRPSPGQDQHEGDRQPAAEGRDRAIVEWSLEFV